MQKNDLHTIVKMIETFLPTVEQVNNGSSAFCQGNAQRAFLATYEKSTECRAEYEAQIERANQFVSKFKDGKALTVNDKCQLATDLSNSPVNVSFGLAQTNTSTGKYMDYNPGSPRSKYLFDTFQETFGFIPPKKDSENKPSSYFTDKRRKL